MSHSERSEESLHYKILKFTQNKYDKSPWNDLKHRWFFPLLFYWRLLKANQYFSCGRLTKRVELRDFPFIVQLLINFSFAELRLAARIL